MTIKTEINIKAPVERVFDAFTDFPKIEERVAGIKKIEFLEKDGRARQNGGQAEVGMKWRETRVMFGKEATEEMWITEINHNKNYVVEAQSHGTKYRSEYVFSSNDGVTTVSLTFAGKPITFGASLGAMLGFLFQGSVKKALLADMEDLKKAIELG